MPPNLLLTYAPLIVCLLFAVALAVQGLLAMREKRAMRTTWATLEGVVAEASPLIERDSEGASWRLRLVVDTAEGRHRPRDLLAKSEAQLQDLARAYAVGSAIVLRLDPKRGVLWVDGQTPETGPAWLFAAALGLVGLGAASALGWFQGLGGGR